MMCRIFQLVSISLVVVFLNDFSYSAPLEDEVDYLPGWSPRPLVAKQYSGFVDAGSKDGLSLSMHYWLTLAEDDPENSKPLVFWFNGGPGASSLYGFLVELGPYLLSDDSLKGPEYELTKIPQLMYNSNGWQKSAAVVALSMPPPIGFSFCSPPGPAATGTDCGAWNDTSTAEATFAAVASFFVKFPEMLSRNIFLAGESYAGVYVPMLAQQILAHPSLNINLKGIAVGDACTPPDICGSKQVGPYWNIEFLYGKGAFSNALYESIEQTCSQYELIHGGLTAACQTVVDKIAGEVGGYWAYAYYDDCWYENDIRRVLSGSPGSPNGISTLNKDNYYGPPISKYRGGGRGSEGLGSGSVDRSLGQSEAQVEASSEQREIDVPNGYYCGGSSAQIDWLALPVVKSALHVPLEASFFQTDNGVGFEYHITEADVISFYKDVISKQSIRVLVYNGDTDPCINSFQAQNWTRSLGFSETQPWRPWTLDNCQRMGGAVTRYMNGLDFLTIRGSGHMVPQFKSAASLEFFTKWINNQDYLTYDASCTAPPPSNLQKDRSHADLSGTTVVPPNSDAVASESAAIAISLVVLLSSLLIASCGYILHLHRRIAKGQEMGGTQYSRLDATGLGISDRNAPAITGNGTVSVTHSPIKK